MDGSVRASVRISEAAGGETQAERARIAGERLSGLGFEVLRIGRRGISIEGEPTRYAEVFGVDLEPGKALTLEVNPPNAEIKDLVDFIEVAPAPVSFGRRSSPDGI